MSSQTRSIEHLQQALSMEMTAIQQYLLHAHVLEDWGLDRLGARMREEMQEELGHAGRFIDRILYLGGAPAVTAQKQPVKAETLPALFRSDLKEEQGAIAFYSDAARAAGEDADIGTRVLFEQIVVDEEGHAEWLDLQLSLIDRLGEPTYSIKQMSDGA